MKNEFTAEQDIFQRAAKLLFNSNVQRLKQKDTTDAIILNDEQVAQLANKICLLPEDWQDALLLCFGCDFDTDLSGNLLDTPDVSDQILYAQDVLANGMNVPEISKESMAAACHIVFQDLRGQLKLEQKDTPISSSENLDIKIRRLIRKQSTVRRRISFIVVAKRVAMVFLALLVASTVTVLSVEALRTKFFDWLFSVFPTHTRVEFVDAMQTSGIENTGQLSQFVPTYIPEGFMLVDTVETDSRYKVYYENEISERIVFEVNAIKDQAHKNVNTENTELEEVFVNDNMGYYVYDGISHQLFWSNDLHFFIIICDTTRNDAIKIAESTKNK